ncbi:MAG: PAS domain S-box protein [Asgard group archaeon]|nr:PAS domain S-box protein [Asgard group archaeon]
MRVNENKKDKSFSYNKSQEKILSLFEDMDVIKLTASFSGLLNVRITLLDKNSEIIYTSNNSEEIIGYSFEDFKLLATFGFIHPDDRDKVIANFNQFNSDGYSSSIIYRIFKPSGEMRWIRGKAQKFVDKETNKQIGTIIMEFDITEEINLIHDLPLSEESQYKTFIELIKVPILYMRNNAIVWATKVWEKFFGYKLNEVKNQSIEMLFKTQDDYANFLLKCNQTLKSEGSITYNTELISKTDVQSKIDIYAYTIDKNNLSKGILFFFLDVTDIEELKYIYDKTIEFYRSTADNLNALFIRIENLKIIWNNKFTEEFLLYDNNELIGESFEILFQTKDTSKRLLTEVNKKIIENKNLVGEIQCIRKDRMPVNLSFRSIPIYHQKINDFILLMEPISELRQLVNNLRDERSELEYYSDLLFHDVKNFCQDSLSQLDLSLLKMDESPSEAKQRQKKSRIGILRIAELVNNMDKFFKIRRSGYELFSYDIYMAVEKAKTKILSKYDHRKILIKNNLDPQKCHTLGNELLEDVFLNLLDNIIMLDRISDVSINISIKSSEENKKNWLLEIRSSNPDVAIELNKYFKSKLSKTEGGVYGIGFSLTLAKTIIESMNGLIKISEKEDKQFTTLFIEIPKFEGYE